MYARLLFVVVGIFKPFLILTSLLTRFPLYSPAFPELRLGMA